MSARVVVLAGAAEKGQSFEVPKEPSYVQIIEGRRGKPPTVKVGTDVAMDDRVAELKHGRTVVHLRNLRPFSIISVNGDQSLDQGQRAILHSGDAFTIKELVLRVVVEDETPGADSEDQSTFEGANESQVVSAIVDSKSPEDTADFGRLVGASEPERLTLLLHSLQAATSAAFAAATPKALASDVLAVLGNQFATAKGSVLMRVPLGDQFRRLARLRQESKEFRVSRTVLRQVMADGKAILSLDTAADPRLLKAQSLSEKQMRSVLCMPIKRDMKVIGVIHLDDTATKTFDESDLALVGLIARTFSEALVGLDRRRIEKSGEEKQLVGPVLRAVASASTPEEGFASGGATAAVGFLGAGIPSGTFATALPLGAPSQNTPILMAAGEVSGESNQSAVAAFQAQVTVGVLAREGAAPEALAASVQAGLAESALPMLQAAIVARWDPGDAALTLQVTPGSVAVHLVATEPKPRVHTVPPAAEGAGLTWSPGTMELARGDTMILGTAGLTKAAGDAETFHRIVTAAEGASPAELVAAIAKELAAKDPKARAGMLAIRYDGD